MVAAPVAVLADIGYTGNTLQLLGRDEGEELFPHGCQIDEVARLAEVLLRNLQFHHVGCLLNLVEHGTIGFAGLEVQGTVLGL